MGFLCGTAYGVIELTHRSKFINRNHYSYSRRQKSRRSVEKNPKQYLTLSYDTLSIFTFELGNDVKRVYRTRVPYCYKVFFVSLHDKLSIITRLLDFNQNMFMHRRRNNSHKNNTNNDVHEKKTTNINL